MATSFEILATCSSSSWPNRRIFPVPESEASTQLRWRDPTNTESRDKTELWHARRSSEPPRFCAHARPTLVLKIEKTYSEMRIDFGSSAKGLLTGCFLGTTHRSPKKDSNGRESKKNVLRKCFLFSFHFKIACKFSIFNFYKIDAFLGVFYGRFFLHLEPWVQSNKSSVCRSTKSLKQWV